MNPPEPTVFVVGDDAAIRSSMERLICSVGWKAETFAAADAFLERLPFAGTACLLLDVQMPGTTGIALQDLMCEQAWDLPVVFLTGRGDVPTCAESMKKGAVDFLLKPVDDELLLAALRRGLDRHAAQRERDAQRHGLQGTARQRLAARAPGDGRRALRPSQQADRQRHGDLREDRQGPPGAGHGKGVRSVAELVSLCGADIVARASMALREAAEAG